MSTNRNPLIFLVLVLALGLALYWENAQSKTRYSQESPSEFIGDEGSSDGSTEQFAGYDCTQDCSGHEAGYRWAEEHNISDGGDCDAAGQHSNSPSFAEGCHAYVDGEVDPESDGDTGRDDSDDPEDDN